MSWEATAQYLLFTTAKPVTMLVTYRPKKGNDWALLKLLYGTWAALNRAGLVT